MTKTKKKEIRREQRHAAETSRQANFEIAYQKLSLLDNGLMAGDPETTREWLDVASFLIDGFRETPELFPRDGVGCILWQVRVLTDICRKRNTMV
jgi:hypothetical protein